MFGQNAYPIGFRLKRGSVSGFGGFGRVVEDPTFIVSLYRIILGREPDTGGFAFWNNAYAESGNKYWVLAAFIAAAEANKEPILSRVLPQYGITTPPTPSQVAQVVATSETVRYDPNTGQVVSTVAPITAGFDLGSSWPILAIAGVVTFIIFRKGSKSKVGRKGKRK